MPIDIAAVQGRPASVRTLDAVGHHQMGMQQRIALAGCPVVEPDRQHPLSGHVLDTAMAAAGPKVLVQVGDRLGQPGMMGGQHGPASGWVSEAVDDRHALGRPQDHIKGWDGVAAMRAAQQLPGRGVAALEHGLEPRHGCFALQPEAAGAGAVPAAWGLTVAGQILLVVGGQLAGVVLLPPHRQLGDVGYHPPLPSRPSLARANAPVVHCSSDDFGLSVERTATLHPLWQALCRGRAAGVRLPGQAALSVRLERREANRQAPVACCCRDCSWAIALSCLTRHSVGRAVLPASYQRAGGLPRRCGGGCRGLDALPAPGWRQYRGCPRAR
jgi:hypothetical protein